MAPRSLPYLWLFLALWLAILLLVWLPGYWNAYDERGNEHVTAFQLTLGEYLVVSAIVGLIGSSFITVLVRWTHLWLVSKPIMTTPAPANRRSRWIPLLLTTVILFVAGSTAFLVSHWATGPTSLQAASRQVQLGMTLKEVEAILGPGTQVNNVPGTREGPVVRGDVFYRWTATELYGEEFIVGFKAGVVFDKWYHNLNYL